MMEDVIRQVLEARVDEFAAAMETSVGHENKRYVPPSGKTYLKTKLIPAPGSPADACNAIEDTGIFQIDIIAPPSKGVPEADRFFKALRQRFKLDQIIESGGIALHQASPLNRGPAQEGPDRYFLPTYFQYLAENEQD